MRTGQHIEACTQDRMAHVGSPQWNMVAGARTLFRQPAEACLLFRNRREQWCTNVCLCTQRQGHAGCHHPRSGGQGSECRACPSRGVTIIFVRNWLKIWLHSADNSEAQIRAPILKYKFQCFGSDAVKLEKICCLPWTMFLFYPHITPVHYQKPQHTHTHNQLPGGECLCPYAAGTGSPPLATPVTGTANPRGLIRTFFK